MANFQRRRRRQRLVTQAREASLKRVKGGSSYKAGKFGAEHASTRGKTQRGRLRGRGLGRGKGIAGSKRDALKRHRSRSSTSSSLNSSRSSSEDDTDTECAICGEREPPPVAMRCIARRGKAVQKADWVQCDLCQSWIHCFCADIDASEVMDAF